MRKNYFECILHCGLCLRRQILHSTQIWLLCIHQILMFINIFDFQLFADYKSPHKGHCGWLKPLHLDRCLSSLDCSFCKYVSSFQTYQLPIFSGFYQVDTFVVKYTKIKLDAWPVTSAIKYEWFHSLCAFLSPQETVALRECCNMSCSCTGVPGPPGHPGLPGQKVRAPQFWSC